MVRIGSLLAVVLVGALAAAAPAQQRLDLPGPDARRLLAEDVLAREQGQPERFAWPADLALGPEDGAGWDRLPDGRHRWRLQVTAPGSLNLNFGFRRFRLPWGARLTITGTGGPRRTFTAADNRDDGQLWTPVVLGDQALLTLELPAGSRDDFALELQRVGRGYRRFGDRPADKSPGDCNIDVICPEGDPWRAEIRSVAVYTLNGVWTCTGAMINNTARDGTPYFLTAAHCGVTMTSAATLVVYWNYESPVCGQLGGGSLTDVQSGAAWRATYAASDMTLAELSALPDTSWHVTYAGWDRSGAVPAGAVAIHHPSTDVKCISFENDPLQITSYLQTASPGNGTHWRVVDWDLGTTEPGSSGSPLFSPAGFVIGQLHGGWAACGNDESDWYGRLSVSWTGGGTDASRLSNWLDPLATGALTLSLHDPRAPEPPDDPDPDPEPRVVLSALWPNPSQTAVTISYRLREEGHVRLAVYDLRGRLVRVLVDDVRAAGDHLEEWVDPRIGSGVYVCRLRALGTVRTAPLTRLR
jgi:lysyl endopeptidase